MELFSIFGDYRFLAASSYLTSAVCLILSFLIFSANFTSIQCRLAALFNLSVGLWAFFYGGMLLQGDSVAGFWSSKFLTCFAILLGCFYTNLVVLLRRGDGSQKVIVVFNYVYAVILIMGILLSDNFVGPNKPKLDLPAYTDVRELYFLVPLHTGLNVLYCTFLILTGLKKVSWAEKKQLKILLAATLIGFCTGMTSYLLVFNVPLKPILNPLVIVNPVLVAYAIVRHRFLDIRKLARNTLVFSLLFICLLFVLSVLLFVFQKALLEYAGLSRSVCQLLAIALALMLYGPLKRFLSALTQKLLFQNVQDSAVIFQRLSEDLFHFLDTQKLVDTMTTRVAACLSLEQIAFYRRTDANNSFSQQTFLGRQPSETSLSADSALPRFLEYSESVLLNPYGASEKQNLEEYKLQDGEEQFRQGALNWMIEREWVLALPIFDKDRLDSLILMGHKKSDAAWTQEELGVLDSFAHCFSLALINADAAESIRALQRKFLASEREASAGVLIAGVDHEAKNPLHATSLALSNLQEHLNKSAFLKLERSQQEETVKEVMGSVLEDIAQVNAVIQHLSDLADQKPLHICANVPLVDVWRKALKSSGVSEQLCSETHVEENFSLTCDPNVFEEILTNLIRNSAQAGADKVILSAKQERSAVTIEMRDNGSGISSTIEKRIFEPFFTTKNTFENSTSKGTGMGLFIVREAMRAMGGDIDAISNSNTGAVFRLSFNDGRPLGARGPRG